MRSRILLACDFLLLSVGAGSLALSCTPSAPQNKVLISERIQPAPGLKLTVGSKTFTGAGALPSGAVTQMPELHWSAPPQGTAAMALAVEDPDAPGAQPFTHFLMVNSPSQRHSLFPGQSQRAVIGTNDAGATGYYGPHPPKGSGVHHYHFEVFALKQKLDLKAGFSRDELVAAMDGKVLASGEVVGTFEAN